MKESKSKFTPSHQDEFINDLETPRDYYGSLPEVRRMKKRLYNPKLRTPISQEVWNQLPEFLELNRGALVKEFGTEHFSVHMHGSMLLGIGTEGASEPYPYQLNVPDAWKPDLGESPSDVDFVIFTGERIKPRLGFNFIIIDFLNKVEFRKKFGFEGDGEFIEVPNLVDKIKSIDLKIGSLNEDDKLKLDEEDGSALYYLALLFGSDSIYESFSAEEAKYKNLILKTIFELKHGEEIWNGIRTYFNHYFPNYETTSFNPRSLVRHKNRVDQAITQILNAREVDNEKQSRAASYLKKQRTSIRLPEFSSLLSLKDKVV